MVFPGFTPVPRHVLDLLARTGSDDESLELLLRGQAFPRFGRPISTTPAW